MVSARLRVATAGDRRAVFEWRNDPLIVSLGGSRRAVTWEEHTDWYDRVLDDGERHLLFIVESKGRGIGTVRFDREGEDVAMVTIYLLPAFIGRGFGVPMLREGCSRALSQWPSVRVLRAEIRVDNLRSIRAFEKAGFRPSGKAAAPDEVTMSCSRPEAPA
jgi:UDP-2,4-diacetamido-2,4,6-trideoxy-beta-L-altropyranose hydrolase